MSQLVVGESGYLIVLLLVGLRCIRSCRRLSLPVLDWGVESSCADHCCLTYSTYAGGSCGSSVPFYDMCNTQLRVGLLSFLLHILFACILLWACTCLGAWLQDSFLRFPRRDPWFFQPMCPWHLGRLVFVAESTPLGIR